MRYIEYVYLVIAVAVGGFIAMNYKNMTMTNVVMSGLGAGIAAFMYSFRRSQRLLWEKKEQEDLEELKRKAGDG